MNIVISLVNKALGFLFDKRNMPVALLPAMSVVELAAIVTMARWLVMEFILTTPAV